MLKKEGMAITSAQKCASRVLSLIWGWQCFMKGNCASTICGSRWQWTFVGKGRIGLDVDTY
eukprot:12409481-Karenia_brevis.AAC.1